MNLYEFATQPSPMPDEYWQTIHVTTVEQFIMINQSPATKCKPDSDIFRMYCLFVWWATQPDEQTP